MTFIRVGDLLTNHKRSLYPQQVAINAMQVMAAWKPILKQIKCVEKFERTRPLSYREGRLTVQAASNTIASELKMCEDQIIAAYVKHFKGQVIQKLIIKRN